MENNVELIKSLFVDIDPSIINNDKLDIKDIPKEVIMYLKKLLKYTSGVKAFKTYHSIEKIYDERKQNKELLYEEFEMALYLTYIMNANIISEEEKKSLIENIISFYTLRLSNERVLSLKNRDTMNSYSYVDMSSKHIYTTIGKVKSLNKNNYKLIRTCLSITALLYKSDGLVDILDKQITSIMKAFLGLFKEDMRILSETDNKKLIK